MIAGFFKDYRFLSNFYSSKVEYMGVVYPSVENAFQAAKAPRAFRSQFTTCTAVEAKKLGRTFQLPPNWSHRRLVLMEKLVLEKFKRNRRLKKLLLSTRDEELVEDNGWNDTFWGVCHGVGENHLGQILMKVREELRT